MAGLISLSKATSEFIQEKKLYVKQLFFFFLETFARLRPLEMIELS